MGIKTNELQKVSSILATDSFLADTDASGTARVPGSVAAAFFKQQLGDYVATFKGRTGAVIPTKGDYDIDMLSMAAIMHRNIYRGKNLGTTVTTAQFTAISNGTFDDLYIGDYWVIGGVNWRIADFDYWLNFGDAACNTHHAVIVPDTGIVTGVKMNSTNIVTGAYVGSDYYTGANGNTARETAGNIIKAAFGNNHILAHRVLLQNTVPEGKGYTAVWGGWYDAHPADLMSEEMVYGCKEFKNEVAGENLAGNYTVDFSQLALFRLDRSRICNRASWWLRGVATGTNFSGVGANGDCNCRNASIAFEVRPAFAICA